MGVQYPTLVRPTAFRDMTTKELVTINNLLSLDFPRVVKRAAIAQWKDRDKRELVTIISNHLEKTNCYVVVKDDESYGVVPRGDVGKAVNLKSEIEKMIADNEKKTAERVKTEATKKTTKKAAPKAGRKAAFDDLSTIKVLKDNPYNPNRGHYHVFELYAKSKTVGDFKRQAREAGIRLDGIAHLRHDIKAELVAVGS
jgi:hypothetical protein